MLKGLPKVFNEQPEKSTMTSAIESQRRYENMICSSLFNRFMYDNAFTLNQ